MGDCVLVPISPAVFHVASNLLASRGLWSATFAVDIPKLSGYQSPDRLSEEWQQYENEVSQFLADGLEFMTRFDDFLKTQLRIEVALTGQTIDLDHPENYLSGELSGSSSVIEELDNIDDAMGALRISLREALDGAVGELEAVNTNLDEIRAAIAAQTTGDPEDLADDLEGIMNTISTIAGILGVVV